MIHEGCDLLFIDSFKDRLPEVDGLYIGGGFPEFFLNDLEANQGLRHDILRAAEGDLPVYAECAGLMYLCRSIVWQDRSYEMVGIFQGQAKLLERPQGHGYVIAEVTMENPWFPVGENVRGHEFHHSTLLALKNANFAYRIKRGRGIERKKDGIVYRNVFASYLHLHTSGTPEWAKSFASLAFAYHFSQTNPLRRRLVFGCSSDSGMADSK